jgi:CrcB protein
VSAWLILGVAILGGLGAVGRFVIHGQVSASAAGSFPAGTLAVNLLGAFLLGLLVGLGTGHDLRTLLGTGLLGAFTTFSTWMLETERLAEDSESHVVRVNLVMPLLVGLALVLLGRELGQLL